MDLSTILSIVTTAIGLIFSAIAFISVMHYTKKQSMKDGIITDEERQDMLNEIKIFTEFMTNKLPNIPVKAVMKQLKQSVKDVSKKDKKIEKSTTNKEEIY